MTPTKLHISVNRESDGTLSICQSLKETEEQERTELRVGHGDEAKLLKFVTVSTRHRDTAAAIDAIVVLMKTNTEANGSLFSVFDPHGGHASTQLG